MSKFIPFPMYADKAAVDISHLFADEKPAGKHGFLTVQGDRFVFEDGTPVRFWGTNLNSGAAFPEKPYAEKLAKRLAAFGCNIVRLHQIDADWATPNIYQFRKGKRLSDTKTYDPESFDRMDYLIYCLKKEGIYVYLDMLTYRKFKEEDGVRNAVALGNNASPYCQFDPTLIELQKGYMRALWLHHNPYTGLDYKDDPVFVLSDVVNESCLFGCFDQTITVEPYATEFRGLFADWCKEKGYTVDAFTIDLGDRTVLELNEFKTELTEKFYGSMIEYMRSLGVRIPITGPNYTWLYLQTRAAQHVGDFMDNHPNIYGHTNWAPDDGRYFRHLSLHEQPDWGMKMNTRHRRFGKPFFTSEWDLTFPSKYRAESTILFASVGMLQNWSGNTIHTYAYSSLLDNVHLVGKEVNSQAIGGVGYREGMFSTWNDPAKFGMFYYGSIITRRGDVSPAKNKLTVRVDELEIDRIYVPGGITSLKKPAFDVAAEMSQIGTDYYGEFEDTVPDDKCLVDLSKGEVASDTGELYRSWEKRYGYVDTPMTKSVYGLLAQNGEIVIKGMKVKCDSEYATIALTSLNNDLDLEHTDAMLLTAMGDAQNTDMKVAPAPEGKDVGMGKGPVYQLLDYGKPPIVCEVIEAEISIKTDRRNLVCWSVNAEGFFAGRVPVAYEDGYAKIKIGESFPSVYYFIQAE